MLFQIDSAKLSTHEYEKERLDKLKKLKGIVDVSPSNNKPKRKKIKGVNPLAMKKKKRKEGQPVAGKSVAGDSSKVGRAPVFENKIYSYVSRKPFFQ